MTPLTVVLRSNALAIRTATESFEISRSRAVLDEQHYLKAGRPAGHVLWQGIYPDFADWRGRWVGEA